MSQIVTITISIALPDGASLSVDTGAKNATIAPAAISAAAPAPAPAAQQANDPEQTEPVKRGRGRPRKADSEPAPAPMVALASVPAATGYRTMPEQTAAAPTPTAPQAATTGGVMDSVKALLGDWQ